MALAAGPGEESGAAGRTRVARAAHRAVSGRGCVRCAPGGSRPAVIPVHRVGDAFVVVVKRQTHISTQNVR